MSVILKYRLAKQWAKNRVVTIAKWIKREWSKLGKKRLCNPQGITRNQLKYTAAEGRGIADSYQLAQKKNSRRIHARNEKCR